LQELVQELERENRGLSGSEKGQHSRKRLNPQRGTLAEMKKQMELEYGDIPRPVDGDLFFEQWYATANAEYSVLCERIEKEKAALMEIDAPDFSYFLIEKALFNQKKWHDYNREIRELQQILKARNFSEMLVIVEYLATELLNDMLSRGSFHKTQEEILRERAIRNLTLYHTREYVGRLLREVLAHESGFAMWFSAVGRPDFDEVYKNLLFNNNS
jgi:hypothetical protein